MQPDVQLATADGDGNDRLLPHYLMLRNAAVDPKLPKAAVAVLAVLVEHYNRETRKAWPGCDRIAKITGTHRTTVLRSIDQLEAGGYVTVTRSANQVNEYRFNWPTSRDWQTGSTDATGRADATGHIPAQTGSVDAHDRSHSRTKPVALVRPEPAFNPPINTPIEPEKLSLAPLAGDQEGKPGSMGIPTDPCEFDRFWKTYPRKVGDKAKARKSWERKNLDRIADRIIDDVTLRAQIDPRWQDAQFIPHPNTFLNGSRWEDEWQTGNLVQRQGESRNDLINRVHREREQQPLGRISAADRVAAINRQALGIGDGGRKPSAADSFQGKRYESTPYEQMPDWMRKAWDDAHDEQAQEGLDDAA